MIIGESRQVVERYQEGKGGYGSRCTEEKVGKEKKELGCYTRKRVCLSVFLQKKCHAVKSTICL